MAENPLKIDHKHIIDSLVEIRFVPLNRKTSFIELLGAVSKIVPEYNYTPSDVPKQIRAELPQFQFAVEATLIGPDFSIGVGSNSLVFNCQNGYKTWGVFFPFISNIIGVVSKLSTIKEIKRVGIRFTNFFATVNDLSKFNVSFHAGDLNQKDTSEMVLKWSTMGKVIAYNVTLANNASVQNRGLAPGTLLDVDAYIFDLSLGIGDKALLDKIEFVHSKEKEMFFSLLERKFLQSLNPVYSK